MACQFDPDARPSFEMITSELGPAVSAEVAAASRGSTFLGRLSHFTSAWSGIMGRAIYGQIALPGTKPALKGPSSAAASPDAASVVAPDAAVK